MQKIVLGSANAKKVVEIQQLLTDFEILPRPEGVGEVVESEDTFLGNSVLKARAVSEYSHQLALADDSGLVVEELSGRPGVYSSRYAGPGATDRDNVAKLLAELNGVTNRNAFFCCVIVICRPDGKWKSFEGRVSGSISKSPRGERGFGYDPIFEPESFHGKTFAEMSLAEKNRISHRAVAMEKLSAFVHSDAGAAFIGQ